MTDLNAAVQNILAARAEKYCSLRQNRRLPYSTHSLKLMCVVGSAPEKIPAWIHECGVPENLIHKVLLLAKTFPNNIIEAITTPEQFFAPKLSSNVLPDGCIVSSFIEEMFPFPPRGEYHAALSLPEEK